MTGIAYTALGLVLIVVTAYLTFKCVNLAKNVQELKSKVTSESEKKPKVVTYITDNDTGRTSIYDPNSHITINNSNVKVNNILVDRDKLLKLNDIKQLSLDDPLEDDPKYLEQVATEYEKLKRDLKI